MSLKSWSRLLRQLGAPANQRACLFGMLQAGRGPFSYLFDRTPGLRFTERQARTRLHACA